MGSLPPVMENQRSFLGNSIEVQDSLRCVGTENHPRKGRPLEKQVSFQHGTEGRAMERQRSLRGFVEKQKSFRVVIERQLSFMNGERKMKKNESPGKRGDSPLHIAARTGNLGKVMESIRSCNGAEELRELLSKQNLEGETPLYTAADNGHSLTDSHLAKIAKNNGKTALHSAARMGHVEVVKSLIGNDASIGFRTDKKGQTALHMAVKGKHEGIVLELVRPDPKVLSVEDNKGNTPLHIATNKGRTKAGDTALDIAEKIGNAELVLVLKEAGAATAKDLGKPQNPAKHLKQTVSDIRHEVQSQLQQSRQTGARVQRIAKRLKKLHINGLNNAINSATVVAVLIATVAFAAIFTIPGQYEEDRTKGPLVLGEARIANEAPFLVFFIFDSLALFISLAVVVVQTSVVVIEQKAKKKLVFVINKLMWLACLFISIAFVSLSFIVVGKEDMWLAICATVIGGTIMLTTIGVMCYCVVMHRIEECKLKQMRKERSKSRSFSLSHMPSESDILNGELNKRMYAL
ncbi:hypothetical protein HID58_079166 [Brassica napus]|uniref:PGG domain-containing protein n=1 Tax=Brassica napus TaxID=3708 RepID=A0ABQ7Y187_BRANA|nr:hypothetical protein HID58_079166 [Brassica napus]